MGKQNQQKKDQLNINVGEIIARRRNELGMTQLMLSRKCKISPKQICRIEKNHVVPSYEVVDKLEEALGISLMEIVRLQNRERGRKDEQEDNGRTRIVYDFENELALRNLAGDELDTILDETLLVLSEVSKNKSGQDPKNV